MPPPPDGDAPDWPTAVVSVAVVPHESGASFRTWWEDGATLRVEMSDALPEGLVVLSGNPAGLVSLARHLLTLAQSRMPRGDHFDIDGYDPAMEAGSAALRLEVNLPTHPAGRPPSHEDRAGGGG